jgi:hypothetical protein
MNDGWWAGLDWRVAKNGAEDKGFVEEAGGCVQVS